MEVTKWLINKVVAGITNILFKVDDTQLVKVPLKGPLIIVANHINTFDAPVVLSRAYPRPIMTFAKIETFDNPFLSALFKIWGGIPIHRGEVDLAAIKSGIQALQDEKMLIILPEGTRSRDGILGQGKPGVSILAQRSGAPILPVVYYGGEALRDNLKRMRRTPFKIVVGNPFHINTRGKRIKGEVRQEIADEIMYQLSALLPEKYRGVYANIDEATATHLKFDEGVMSNLPSTITSFAADQMSAEDNAG